MDAQNTQRKRSRKLILGVIVTIIGLALTAALVVGVSYGFLKLTSKQSRVLELPVFLSVQSFGTTNNITTFTVQFQAEAICYTERRFGQSGNYVGIEALTRQVSENGTSLVRIQTDLTRVLKYMAVTVVCPEVASAISLDHTALSTPGFQTLVGVSDKIPFNIINSYINTSTGESTVSLTTNKEKKIGYSFNGLNTTTSPAECLSYSEIEHTSRTGKYNTTINVRDDMKEYNIVIDNDLVNVGGVFSVIGITEVKNTYVKDILHTKPIYLRSPLTGAVVPKGHYGFLPPIPKQALDIYSDTYSPLCFIMGNPLPEVETFIRYQNKTTVKIESYIRRVNEYSLLAQVTLTANQVPGGGTFICRSRPGNDLFEREFVFKGQFEPSSIDTSMSGVIEQTSEYDVIRCTATGNPQPRIYMNLYDRYGPDLLHYAKFKKSWSFPNNSTSSVVMTISPPNKDIHTVLCQSVQRDFPRSGYSSHEIELYPGRQDNHTLLEIIRNSIGYTFDN